MSAARAYLFSYGTLQQADVQRATFGRLLSGEADALVGFRLDWATITDADVIAKSGKDKHPIVSRTGDDRDRVAGTVFSISAEDLAAADDYGVDEYERVEARLTSGKLAWVYVQRA